jgi:hypothetical protein
MAGLIGKKIWGVLGNFDLVVSVEVLFPQL